jgi:hypothetical protein
MKGDFTRGHRPDHKRDHKYRRVLLQEGRLVLDSDIAAGVDAVDTQIRDLASDVGCETGSPNLGYLVTPGPLLALFETTDGVTLPDAGGTFEAYRDYAVKYKERFPSIYVGAQADDPGAVTVVGRRRLQRADYPTLRIWARAGVQVDLTIEGQATSFTGTDATQLLPYDVTVPVVLAEYQSLSFGFNVSGADNEAWIAMIEGFQEAEQRPFFWSTRGRYYLRGLAVESAEDGQFPDATFPADKGFTAQDQISTPGVYFVAYLEGWERLITHIEDAGIKEQALGGVLDTTVRSQAIGQVKIALFENDGADPETDAEYVPAAFANVNVGTAQLDVTTTPTLDNLDPCAIPETGGYIGADNRFYRFEVHEGGDLGDVRIKWSKNNGSDAFAVAAIPLSLKYLVLAAGAEVRDGELIELIDETDDLGDQILAEIALGTPQVTPAPRAVGQLFYAETTQTAGQIKLRLTDAAKTPTDVPADFGPSVKVPKVRVWHGLLDTAPLTGGGAVETKFDLGDGVQVELSGASYRPGDYWQYEARKLKDNANGTWKKEPHGPERILAPLALFKYAGESLPVELIRWYDHQYSAICELNADDIAYDGGKVGTSADTVQEAIDELYEKTGGGCCDIVLEAKDSGDDTARIQKAMDDLPDGGELCLHRGVYRIFGTLHVDAKRVTITGCPYATLVGTTEGAPVIEITNGGQLVLRDLLAFARGFTGPVVSIPGPFWGGEEEFGPNAPLKLTLERAAAVHAGVEGVVVLVGAETLPELDARDPTPLSGYGGYGNVVVEAKESLLAGRWGISAQSLQCFMTDSAVLFERVGVYALTLSWLELYKSSFYGSFSQSTREALGETEDEALASQVRQLLDQGFWWTLDNSVCVASPEFWGGFIQRCILVADTSMFFGYGSDIASSDNRYIASTGPAVRIDYATECRFDHDDFNADICALHFPWNVFTLEVTHSTLHSERGMVFGATYEGAVLPVLEFNYSGFSHVRIHENVFNTWAIGVLWGPYFEEVEPDPSYVSMVAIDISSNDFPSYYYSTLAVVCTLNAPPGDDGQAILGNSRLRIAGNQIDTAVGVVAFGDDVIVEDNVIHGTYPLLNKLWLFGLNFDEFARIGVLLFDGARVVVRGNTMELDAADIKQAPSMGIVLHEKYTEGRRTDIVVQNNFVTATIPFASLIGEHGAGVRGLMLLGNRLAGKQTALQSIFDATIRDNVFSGKVIVALGGRNIVSGNRFQYFRSSGSGGLQITSALEEWQVENNQSDGSIVLQPATELSVSDGGVIINELEYHPQVIGNWAKLDLVVGHPQQTLNTGNGSYSFAWPHVMSRVQIVANRAGNYIVTDAYKKIVFASNFAKKYSPPWGQTAPINSPNYDAP